MCLVRLIFSFWVWLEITKAHKDGYIKLYTTILELCSNDTTWHDIIKKVIDTLRRISAASNYCVAPSVCVHDGHVDGRTVKLIIGDYKRWLGARLHSLYFV